MWKFSLFNNNSERNFQRQEIKERKLIINEIMKNVYACCCFSCVWLFCNPMDCSLPGSSVHGLPQASILEWVAILFSRGSSLPPDLTWVFGIVGRFFTPKPMGKPIMKNIFPEIKNVPAVNRLFNHSVYWINRDKKIPHSLICGHFVTVGSKKK